MLELVDLDCGKSKWGNYNKTTLAVSTIDVHTECDNDNKGYNRDLDNGK